MSLQLDLQAQLSLNGSKIKLEDITPAYDATTAPGGYGYPNRNRQGIWYPGDNHPTGSGFFLRLLAYRISEYGTTKYNNGVLQGVNTQTAEAPEWLVDDWEIAIDSDGVYKFYMTGFSAIHHAEGNWVEPGDVAYDQEGTTLYVCHTAGWEYVTDTSVWLPMIDEITQTKAYVEGTRTYPSTKTIALPPYYDTQSLFVAHKAQEGLITLWGRVECDDMLDCDDENFVWFTRLSDLLKSAEHNFNLGVTNNDETYLTKADTMLTWINQKLVELKCLK